jgi:hypothetical protein
LQKHIGRSNDIYCPDIGVYRLFIPKEPAK